MTNNISDQMRTARDVMRKRGAALKALANGNDAKRDPAEAIMSEDREILRKLAEG